MPDRLRQRFEEDPGSMDTDGDGGLSVSEYIESQTRR